MPDSLAYKRAQGLHDKPVVLTLRDNRRLSSILRARIEICLASSTCTQRGVTTRIVLSHSALVVVVSCGTSTQSLDTDV